MQKWISFERLLTCLTIITPMIHIIGVMMVKHKKVTYTLNKRAINTIERCSFLSDVPMSKFVSHCIELSYEMMIDDYYDNDKQPLVGAKKKRSNTIAKTFTLPIDVIRILEFFSDKLGMKKSHLVSASILNYEQMESEKLSQQIKELMDSAEIAE